jgi:ssRNA-specific RNase YbeY (16S rRNA maturation enzyme)
MIEIFVQSRYQVNRNFLRKRTQEFLKRIGIDPSQYTVSIAIIGDRKMSDIHEQYAKKKGTTPVLSFPLVSGKPRLASRIDRKYLTNWKQGKTEGTTLLGEIIISYPQTLIFASDENKLVDVKLAEFVEHGLTKLLSTP